MRDVVFAANMLRNRGVRTVLASLGRDGLVEVNQHEVLWARGPSAKVLNTTGAGDAALAGYLSALPHGSAAPYTRNVVCEALARAVAWGALAVQEPTTILPRVVLSPEAYRCPRRTLITYSRDDRDGWSRSHQPGSLSLAALPAVHNLSGPASRNCGP
ncbi:1-phosphofructokinase [Arthrobacter sp. Hiyo6]|nr:1-phosphofructokinase [Arthrobacter sp. Hiyo6]